MSIGVYVGVTRCLISIVKNPPQNRSESFPRVPPERKPRAPHTASASKPCRGPLRLAIVVTPFRAATRPSRDSRDGRRGATPETKYRRGHVVFRRGCTAGRTSSRREINSYPHAGVRGAPAYMGM